MKGREGKSQRELREWRAFELLIAAIEERLAPAGATVKSPDRIKDLDSGRLREVDASIRTQIGSAEVLITVECRKRSGVADVTWVEQLATKRAKLGAAKTIAVSAKGFSKAALQSATRYGIELRVIGEITSEDIDQWFMPTSLIHIFRVVEAITCKVRLVSGEEHEISSLEKRFRHPEVHGVFPPDVFVNFLEMKNPRIFNEAKLVEQATKMSFVLDAQDPELIPVPLGEQRKEGGLELLNDSCFHPVDKISLDFSISFKAQALEPSEGQHYVYGAPGSPAVRYSQFDTEMFGLPVRIDNFARKDQKPEASISFPSGLKLPGKVFVPRISNIHAVNSKDVHDVPVRVALRDGRTLEGVFFDHTLLIREDAREEFNMKYLAFIEKADRARLRDIAKENVDAAGKELLEVGLLLRRDDIAWIDLASAMRLSRK